MIYFLINLFAWAWPSVSPSFFSNTGQAPKLLHYTRKSRKWVKWQLVVLYTSTRSSHYYRNRLNSLINDVVYLDKKQYSPKTSHLTPLMYLSVLLNKVSYLHNYLMCTDFQTSSVSSASGGSFLLTFFPTLSGEIVFFCFFILLLYWLIISVWGHLNLTHCSITVIHTAANQTSLPMSLMRRKIFK